jgi:purine catabolism regulator
MMFALPTGIPALLEASLRISDLVDDTDLKIQLRVAGDEGRLGRSISWCAPTEHMDPTPFLSVNALVLTNGMGLNVKDFRIWDAYVERLVSVPVSGLAFGLGAAHRELPPGLIQACQARGLPLLELPPEVPFVLVMRHVEQIIASERYEELRKGWQLADECTRLAADGHSLAEVLERVAHAINARVAVVDHNEFELISSGAVRSGTTRTTRTTLRLPSGDSHRFKVIIEGIKSNVVLQPILGPVAAVIAMQLSYTLGSRSPLHSREAARFIEALYEDRGPSSASLRRYALESGFDPDAEWGSVLIGGSEHVAPAKLRAIAWRARVGLQNNFSTVRFMEEAGLTTLLVQHRHGAAGLHEAVREYFADAQELSVMVSESGSLIELPLALQLARRHIGKPGVRRAPLADLAAIVQGLPRPGLVAMSRRLLAPLSSEGGSVLRETLDAYLRHSGNSREICDELFIHRNTLSYRLRKIEQLLQLDLSDGEVRATCMLALSIVAAPQ